MAIEKESVSSEKKGIEMKDSLYLFVWGFGIMHWTVGHMLINRTSGPSCLPNEEAMHLTMLLWKVRVLQWESGRTALSTLSTLKRKEANEESKMENGKYDYVINNNRPRPCTNSGAWLFYVNGFPPFQKANEPREEGRWG